MKYFLVFFLLFTATQGRTWTSSAGSKIEAEFLRMEDEQVVLKKKNGEELSVDLSQLSEEDQSYLKKIAPQREIPNHIRFLYNREPTRPNYDARWPAKAEVLGDIDITKFKEDTDTRQYIYHSPHYEFLCDVRLTLSVVKTFSKLFEATYEAMVHIPMSFDKARTSTPGHRYRILLFADRADYIKNGGPPNSGGVYFPRNDIVMVPLQSLGVKKSGSKYTLDHQVANQTLSHELVHQLMDFTYYKPGSVGWFTEGMAEYVSSSPYQYGRFTFRNNIKTIKNSITKYDSRTRTGSNLGKTIKSPDLKNFMLQSYGSFTANGRLNYALGMAYTTYFIHMDDNGSRKNITAFLKAMRKGQRGEQLVNILLAGRNWDQLEEEIAAAWSKEGIEFIFN
ncbi:SHD1 domain-containing protein [Akkermansiaceae bacterium]|nr:SHD1 domain-containing protein [Akkermansiaceae bacterium]